MKGELRMTREERRKQVIRNRISLGVILFELILVCILIPIAISKFSNKSGSDNAGDSGTGTVSSVEDGGKSVSNIGISNSQSDPLGTDTDNASALPGKTEGGDKTDTSSDTEKNNTGNIGTENNDAGKAGEGNTDTQNTDIGAETEGKTGPDANNVDEPGSVAEAAGLKAAMYDYDGAIELLKAEAGYEEDTKAKALVAEYEAEKAKLVKWPDNTKISHIFVHSLIVDTSRAFGKQSSQPLGYNKYMTTVEEFNRIIESMYAKGYVLVSVHDIAELVTDEAGNKKLVQKDIMLPPGKEPFVLSQDDVNYYAYMDNDGFADRLVVGPDGIPTCQYTDIDGNVSYGEYDVVPIIDRFIKEHPDFSYRGSKGILAVTGYEGALGYDTGLSMKIYDGLSEEEKMKRINAERVKATAVADALKADGWEFASHSYTHSNMTDATIEKMQYDSKRWKDEVEIILGPTDIYIYPYGADICDWHGYKGEKFELLKSYGFWYFCNVDSSRYWIQIRGDYFRMGRINTDGERMHKTIKNLADASIENRLAYFFDVKEVYDDSRPAWND